MITRVALHTRLAPTTSNVIDCDDHAGLLAALGSPGRPSSRPLWATPWPDGNLVTAPDGGVRYPGTVELAPAHLGGHPQ
jgi:hypothetical protein